MRQLFYFSGKYWILFLICCFRTVIFKEDLSFSTTLRKKSKAFPFFFIFHDIFLDFLRNGFLLPQ